MLRALVLIFVLGLNFISAQNFALKGRIIDNETGEGLTYANIRISGSSLGTSTNSEGYFEFKLAQGEYTLIASYIGYVSDTLTVLLNNNERINLKLKPISIKLPEVTVIPGYNPAIRIIRNAIEFKKKREKLILSYDFTAYTKGAIKTTGDITAGGNNISVGVGGDDDGDTSDALKISGILENQSKGYFKKPNNYKEEIIARKQSANFPNTINLLTGGRLIQNFYTNDIRFFDRPLPSPISDEALDYYYFYLADSTALDNQKVYKIFFAPDEEYYPGFTGYIYVLDDIFALIKVDASLNDAANTGGLFTKIEIFQQYLPYAENIYMPIDYRLFIEANFLGLAKFGFDLNTIMYDYNINKEIDDDFFDMAVLTVTGEADKRDSLYWLNVQTIPNTVEEIVAYKRIDSLEAIPKTFWDKFSFLATKTEITDNFLISGPLSIYNFNRVEGHSLSFGLEFVDLFDSRYYTGIDFSYGFSDKKFKTDFRNEYYLGKYRTHSVTFNIYDKNTSLFEETDDYNSLTSTVLSLFSKYDFRDYYRRKGLETNVSSLVLPYLTLGVGYINNTDYSLVNLSDFSFFSKSKEYPINTRITDGKINALTFNFDLDFRKYIEDGLFIRRVSLGKFYTVLSGDILYSNNQLMKTSSDFTIYKARIYGQLNSFRSSRLTFNINAVSSIGAVPIQYLYALPGNISSSGKDFSFRTLNIGEVFGDKVIAVGLEHSFRDELFKLANIPFFKNSEINLTAYVNMAYLDISEKTENILPKKSIKFLSPFYEAGFSLGHPLFPLKFEFTWKLNYKGVNNFTFGINTVLL